MYEQIHLMDLLEMNPKQLQEVKLSLNPHELMEQIHYILKARIIKYSIAIQRQRTHNKKETEKNIRDMNEGLQSETLTQKQKREIQEKLIEKEATLKKMEEHLKAYTVLHLFFLCCSGILLFY